ncbi:MAG: class D sortase [Erysipelotrichaceae bacterium]
MPLSFLILGYSLIYGLASPTLRPLYSIYNTIANEYEPTFTDRTVNLYDGSNGKSDGVLYLKDVKMPSYGDLFGKIEMPSINLDVKLFYGDSEETLLDGAGMFQGSILPGFDRTILIAGHTIPYFQEFGNINKGDEITLSTHYGIFKYKVANMKVGKFNDSSMYDLEQKKKEQLILYTCYPLDGIGFKQERLFIYADKISGPTILGE